MVQAKHRRERSGRRARGGIVGIGPTASAGTDENIAKCNAYIADNGCIVRDFRQVNIRDFGIQVR